MAVWLFCHETSATHNSGTNKRYPSGDGFSGCDTGVWRVSEHISMDWCHTCSHLFFMLSRSGKKEGLDFGHNKWILFLILSAVFGAISGLYDKYLMTSQEHGGAGLPRMFVQSWYNIYQCIMMGCMLMLIWWPLRKRTTPFRWHWSIIFISIFLSAADFIYFYSLSLTDSMISIVSMVRRGSVVVSFLFGALLFHEKNLKGKAVDLLLVLLGMVFLYIGSH